MMARAHYVIDIFNIWGLHQTRSDSFCFIMDLQSSKYYTTTQTIDFALKAQSKHNIVDKQISNNLRLISTNL